MVTAVLSTTAKVKAREKRKAAADQDAMEIVSARFPFLSPLFLIDDLRYQDERTEGKKDMDAEKMASIGSPTEGTSSKRRAEPNSERIANFSRVTPVQLGYVSFPPEGRYQPVRPVTSSTRSASGSSTKKGRGIVPERYGGAGGILVLVDGRPEEEGELIDLEPPAPTAPVASASGGVPNGDANLAGQQQQRHIALDPNDLEASPPGPFEVRDEG